MRTRAMTFSRPFGEVDTVLSRTRHLRFFKHCVLPLIVLPALFLIGISTLIFLPTGYNSPGLLERVNVSISSATTVWKICPPFTGGSVSSICSSGPTQITLLAVSRLSAYMLYAALAASMLSKCYCLMHAASGTVLGLYLPFRCLHDLHRVAGFTLFWGSLLHTASHLARWALRQVSTENGGFEASLGYHLTSRTGLSGLVALLMLIVSVLPMWLRTFFSKRFKLSFESRHFLHLMAVPTFATLCYHHPHVCVVCGVILGVWGLDRAYLFIFRTVRVEDVLFTRLADGSVRMAWRNPSGQRAKVGQCASAGLDPATSAGCRFALFPRPCCIRCCWY